MAEFVVRSLPNIDPAGLDFSVEQMNRVGTAGVIDPQNERLARGVGANDQQMAPLKESYGRFKQRRGRRPVRDMRLTGGMLKGVQVTEVGPNRVSVGIVGAGNALKANVNQSRDLWFGLSPSDARTTDRVMQQEHAENVRRMNR